MYEEKTYENILESILERTDADMDKREGSILYDAAAPVAYHIMKMYFELQNFIDLVLPDTSAGEYLDRFAAAFHIQRKEAGKAVRIGEFDKEIQEGARFSGNGEKALIYKVISFSEKTDGKYRYLLECETPGQTGNEYTGELLPVDYINGLTYAQLKEIEVEGTDAETDEELRRRMFEKIRKPSTSGNANDYYNWAMACNGVGAAKIFPLWDGPGTVKIVIANENRTAAGQGILDNVAKIIEEKRPIGATVTVVAGVEKYLDISVHVKIAKSTNLTNVRNQFHANMEAYLKESIFGLEYISQAKAGSLLMQISGVEDYDSLILNGEKKNIEVGQEELFSVRTITMEVM